MKQIVLTKQEAEDQRHINTAYEHIREAMNELVQVRSLDSELVRALRDVQRDEDVLYQYVASLEGVKIV